MRPNELNTTHFLLKLNDNLLANYLLLLREDNRIPLLLPVLIPDNNPIECWRFLGLSVHIIHAYRVDLNDEAIFRDEVLIDVVGVSPDGVDCLKGAAGSGLLGEEALPASAHVLRVVYADLVVERVEGFLDKGFFEL